MVVSLSTITPQERDAMAGLLQLQSQSIQVSSLPQPEHVTQDVPQSTPEVQHINMNVDEAVQTVTAAWVLSRCFDPNRKSLPYDSVATQNWASETIANILSKSSRNSSTQSSSQRIVFPGQATQPVKICKCINVCCCQNYTYNLLECSNCGWTIGTRDVASQTDPSYSSSSEDEASAQLEKFVREAMLRKNVSNSEEAATSSTSSILRSSISPASPSTSAVKANPTEHTKKLQVVKPNEKEQPALPLKSQPTKPSKNEQPLVVFKAQLSKPRKNEQPAEVLKAHPSKHCKNEQQAVIFKAKPVKPHVNEHPAVLFDEETLMDSDEEWQPTESMKKSKQQRRRYTTSSSNKENMDVSGLSELDETMEDEPITKSERDLVPIGDGNAKVPARLLKHMNWGLYTNVTRKLLTAVFSRNVLATHSLTGKPSPAFPNKPAKKKLDAALVNDIVQTVVERCNVPENVVRTSITTKCADESKMLRTRQRNKKSNKNI